MDARAGSAGTSDYPVPFCPSTPLSALSLIAVSKTLRRRSLTADYADCADTIDPILAVGGNKAVSRVLETDGATRKSSSPMARMPPTARLARRTTKARRVEMDIVEHWA
jgi:hypothetical protein